MEGRRKDLRIAAEKIAYIRSNYFAGTLDVVAAAEHLSVSVNTVRNYEREFQVIKLRYPEHIDDEDFYAPLAAFPKEKLMRRIPYRIISELRLRYFNDTLDVRQACKDFNLTSSTVANYAREFRKISDQYPEKISDRHFYAPKEILEHRQTELYVELIKIIPQILKELEGQPLNCANAFRIYERIYPNGYRLSGFKNYFAKWCRFNNISFQRLYEVAAEDIPMLKQWRSSNDHRLWQISVALLEGLNRVPNKVVAAKIEVWVETIQFWYKQYKQSGLDAFKRKIRTTNENKRIEIKEREDNLIHLLHQSPRNFGLNRTSWKYADLQTVYEKEYGKPVSLNHITRDLRRRGYRALKSREVLTSPDPEFKQKYEAIQQILQNLGPAEKFFSIDEYGPFSLKIKGGRSLVKRGEYKAYPQRQKSKGWLICTAALELSTNQITHFYSLKKNTAEMIKLVDVLVKQYRDQDKIYLSWDKAGWHISKELMDYIDALNSDAYHKIRKIPFIGLAPLPACAQFLNVIESVFSGLARAVIHHSDYQSVEECQQAIDRHFHERNQHFLLNPHRAGKKIWGKELVAPEFDKANRCKTLNSLSTKS